MIGEDRLLLGHAHLRRLKDFLSDDRLMLSVGHDDIGIVKVPAAAAGGIPPELADIHRIAEDILHGTVFKGSAPVGFDAHIVEPAGNGIEALPGVEAAEDLLHIHRLLRDGDQDIILHGVAEGGRGLQLAAAVLFLHAALDVLRQVDGVVFVHGLDHGFHDDAHFALLDGLFDGDHVDLQLLAEDGLIVHRVVPVPGEAGELPQQNGVEGLRLRFGGGDEPAELITARDLATGFGLVHEHIFLRHIVAVDGGPLADLHQLGGGGQLHLIVRGDTDIGRCGFEIGHWWPPSF